MPETAHDSTVDIPADRAALIAELERLEGEIGAAIAPLDEERLNWQPEVKSWSAGQCIEHLARVNGGYLAPLTRAVERARSASDGALVDRTPPPLRATGLGRWMVAQMEPPARLRIPAPRSVAPRSRCEKEEVWHRFRQRQGEAIALIRASAGLDLNRIRFRNPLAFGLPLFSVASGLLLIAAHERRHLGQIQRLLAHPAFPPLAV